MSISHYVTELRYDLGATGMTEVDETVVGWPNAATNSYGSRKQTGPRTVEETAGSTGANHIVLRPGLCSEANFP